MPAPELNPVISDISVIGSPLMEEYFPRVLDRRISPDPHDNTRAFKMNAGEHLDFSLDLYHVLEKNEYIIGAYAWSDGEPDVSITTVWFSQKGAVVYVSAGVDAFEHTITLHVKTNFTETRKFTFTVSVTGTAINTLATYLPPALLTQNDPNYWFFTDLAGRYLGPPFMDAVGTFLNGEKLNMDFINGVYVSVGRSLTLADIVATAGGLEVITGNAFYDWHSHIANTYVIEADTPAVGITTVYRESNGTSDEELHVFTDGTNLKIQVTAGAAVQATITVGTVIAATTFKLAFRLAVNDLAATLNGASVVADGTLVLPLMTQADFGAAVVVDALSVATARLSNSQLVVRSTP